MINTGSLTEMIEQAKDFYYRERGVMPNKIMFWTGVLPASYVFPSQPMFYGKIGFWGVGDELAFFGGVGRVTPTVAYEGSFSAYTNASGNLTFTGVILGV